MWLIYVFLAVVFAIVTFFVVKKETGTRAEKIRRIIGALLTIITSLVLVSVLLAILISLWMFPLKGALEFYVTMNNYYPFNSLFIIAGVFHLFLLWLGIALVRKKFNKNIAVIVSVSLIVLFLQWQFVARTNADTLNKVKFVRAVTSGKPSHVVEKLIKNGLNVNGPLFDFVPRELLPYKSTDDNAEVKPIEIAMAFNKHDIVKVLIENGVDVNSVTSGGDTVLVSAFMLPLEPPNIDIIKLLLENGADADINKACPIGDKEREPYITPLIAAVSGTHNKINPEIIKLLIDYGADVNKVGIRGYTPIVWAAGNKHAKNALDIIKMLVENGADINLGKIGGINVALSIAIQRGNIDICKYLIENGADVTGKDDKNKTLLDYLKENDKISEEDKAELEKLLMPKAKKNKKQ